VHRKFCLDISDDPVDIVVKGIDEYGDDDFGIRSGTNDELFRLSIHLKQHILFGKGILLL
jgi:hypothetical protein